MDIVLVNGSLAIAVFPAPVCICMCVCIYIYTYVSDTQDANEPGHRKPRRGRKASTRSQDVSQVKQAEFHEALRAARHHVDELQARLRQMEAQRLGRDQKLKADSSHPYVSFPLL